MTEPTAAPSGPANDMRELYALQHAIADAGGAMAPGVHKAIDALREVWDRGLRRAQAEAHQYRTALQGAARAAVPAGQAPATDQTTLGFVSNPQTGYGQATGGNAPPVQSTGQAVLTDAERTMLTYALDQAQERIWSEGGFTDEDQAAVTSLRRLAAASAVVVRRATDETPGEAKSWLSDSARIGRALIWSWTDIGKGAFGDGYRAAQAEARALLTGQRDSGGALQPKEARPSCTCQYIAEPWIKMDHAADCPARPVTPMDPINILGIDSDEGPS